MDPVLFLVKQPKNHHLYSYARVDMSTPAKKTENFDLKMDFNDKKT